MDRTDALKAIRAFLKANNLNTNAANNEGEMTNYFFNLNVDSIKKVLDVVISVSKQGDISISVYLDIEKEDVSKDELYKLVNWLNLENSAFIGCTSYIEEDNAIAVIKSLDSYFQKEIYGEDISYLIKLQVTLFEEYFGVIDEVIKGETLSDAIAYYSGNKEKH